MASLSSFPFHHTTILLLSLLAIPALEYCDATSREINAYGDALEQAYDSIYGTEQAAKPRGSLVWRKMRWKLKGFSQDDIKDLLEAFSYLEKEFENSSSSQGESPLVATSISKEEFIDNFDNADMEDLQNRHPADHLLQRYKTDATISYILGGY